MNFFIIITSIYLIIGIILCLLDTDIPNVYIGLLIFFLIKQIINYRKCTISYIECKIRGVEKDEGYLYNFLNGIVDLRNTNFSILIYITGFLILYYHYGIKKNPLPL